ncbi:unnamed protein product [Parajaminaea phylloscopi]
MMMVTASDPVVLRDVEADNEDPTAEELPASSSSDTYTSETVQIVPARPATCTRPPCLKRAVGPTISSTPAPLSEQDTRTARSVSSPGYFVTTVRSYSFSSPRSFSDSRTGRPCRRVEQHVHFDAGPPEAFDTHSAEDYDRSQIECTRDGSALDLRLSSRCKRYNGEGEEDPEDVTDGEADEATEGSARSMPFGSHGSTGWACLRSGSVIVSLSAPPLKTTSSAEDQGNQLPSRGIRSFGRLSHEGVMSSTSEPSDPDEQDMTVTADASSGMAPHSNRPTSLVGGAGERSRAFDTAALALKSPDATPKPSPSIVPRWTRSTDYFAAPADDDDADDAQSTRACAPFRHDDGDRLEILSPAVAASGNDTMVADRAAQMALESRPSTRESTSKDEVEKASREDAFAPVAPVDCGSHGTPLQSLKTNATQHDQGSPVIAVIDASPSIAGHGTAASTARRPSFSRSRPFISPTLQARSHEDDMVSSPCELPEQYLGLHFALGPSESSQSLQTVSSPSPMSSRCSSVDPWTWTSSSCLSSSSGDSDEGCTSHRRTGVDSPLGDDLGSLDALGGLGFSKTIPDRPPSTLVSNASTCSDVRATESGSHSPSPYHSDDAAHVLPTTAKLVGPSSRSHCPSTMLKTALSRIQAHWMERDGQNSSNSSYLSSSSSLEDRAGESACAREGMVRSGEPSTTKSPRSIRCSSRKMRESSSSSNSSDCQSPALSEGGREHISSLSSSSSTCSAFSGHIPSPLHDAGSGDPLQKDQEAGVPASGSVSAKGTSKSSSSRRKSSRSSSSSSSRRSSRSCAAASPSLWGACSSIEDEGALGGF